MFTYLDHTYQDDLTYYGCNYVNAYDGYTYPANSTYESVAEIYVPPVRKAYQSIFGLTDE